MSLGEQLRSEGRVEGRVEEKIEVAMRLLKEGVEPVFIAKITELPIEKIKGLISISI